MRRRCTFKDTRAGTDPQLVQNTADSQTIEEELNEFDVDVKRLRIEYESYFRGASKRPPSHLASKVQRMVTRFAAEPPRNTAQKFRLNSLIARYQAFRQQWGRILREIDAGTYQPHRFLKNARNQQAAEPSEPAPAPAESAKPERTKAIDQLHDRLIEARQKAGQKASGMSKEALEKLVRDQTRKIREQHGDVRVSFRVEVTDGKARLKARVSSKK
jgi:hypothetical protein